MKAIFHDNLALITRQGACGYAKYGRDVEEDRQHYWRRL